MDITPDNKLQNIDEQELAKALAGALPDAPAADAAAAPAADAAAAGLNFEETPAADATDDTAKKDDAAALPDLSSLGAPADDAKDEGDLEDIKLTALKELRPLMDKVELPAGEKFHTYLMLIRSTDDSTLIEPAHKAAQSIEDEKEKAEALLEIIKEIDYLSQKEKK